MDTETKEALRALESRFEDRAARQDRLIAGQRQAMVGIHAGLNELALAILDETEAGHATYRLAIGLAAAVAEAAEDPLQLTESLRALALDILPHDLASKTRDKLEHALTLIETHAAKRQV